MDKRIILSLIILSIFFISNCQIGNKYQVFAVKFYDGRNMTSQNWIVGANPKDSIRVCNMVWLLKGENGRNILVDAGFIDSSITGRKNYVRPDLMKRMKTLVTNPDFIIPGHDDLVFSKFPKVSEWVVRIGN